MTADVQSTAPGAPRDVNVTPQSHGVVVKWKAPAATNGTIDGYVVKVFKGARASGTPKKSVTTSGSEHSALIDGLVNGDEYTISVRAKNQSGLGKAAAGVQARPRTKPGAPRDLSAVAGASKLTLSWKAPSSNGGAAINSYEVKVYNGATASGSALRTIKTHSSAIRYAVTGLTDNHKYTCTVRATNAAGTGPASPSVSGIPSASTPPTPTPHPTPHPTPMASHFGRRSAGSLPTSWRRTASTRPQGPPRG